jgi:hypothetical protein
MQEALAIQSADRAVRRPDLNGLRLQMPGQDAQYLILDGYKCQIPDRWTAQGLFVEDPLTSDADLDEITTGTGLAEHAVLAQGTSGDRIYLISYPPAPGSIQLVKMLITQRDTFNRYQFNRNKIHKLAQVVIDAIPNGPIVPPVSALPPAHTGPATQEVLGRFIVILLRPDVDLNEIGLRRPQAEHAPLLQNASARAWRARMGTSQELWAGDTPGNDHSAVFRPRETRAPVTRRVRTRRPHGHWIVAGTFAFGGLLLYDRVLRFLIQGGPPDVVLLTAIILYATAAVQVAALLGGALMREVSG